ncbi:MAG TPA: tetratricopeptide repeat protein [Pyrinomonadaceae bacterium]|nr:tetratricopeptide repeat protein [Pyrinomonadaceae bacterium]
MMRRSKIFQLALTILIAASAARAQDYLPELVRRIKPSVVAIVTYDSKGEKLTHGSGFFIAPDRVVTNRHVLEGAYSAEVHLVSGNIYRVKGVLAVDGEGDIAVLQADVPANMVSPLPVVRTSPQEGESIVVIGNPLGLEGSVSNGIVSAVRDITNFGRIIQITAPISPGSSGSPVVNMRGQVIGVATLQLTEGQSLNFAVPSERVAQLQPGTLRTLAELVVATRTSQRAAAERFYMQGLGFLSRDDCDKALPYFMKAVDADADYADAWAQAGFCNEKLGRHAEALKASNQAIRLRPNSPESHFNLGLAYFYLGQYKESSEAYRQVIRLDPYNADAHYVLGLTYGKLGRAEDEVQYYKKAINLKPDYAGAYEALASAYMRLGRHAEAVGAFKQLTLLKPGDANTFNSLGEAYVKMNKNDEGIEAFNQAIRLKPDFGKAYYNLGRAYLARGDRDNALVQYNILRTLNPDWADRLYNVIYP